MVCVNWTQIYLWSNIIEVTENKTEIYEFYYPPKNKKPNLKTIWKTEWETIYSGIAQFYFQIYLLKSS